VKQNLKILSETFLFKGLSQDQLEQVARIAVSEPFERGEVIFNEEDVAGGFYVVEEGTVKVFKVSADGKEQILHIFGPGEPVGEVSVFAGKEFPASAQAITACRLLFFSRSNFVQLISENPSLALNMLALLSIRLRQFTAQIETLSLKEVPARLAAYLGYLADEQDTADSVTLPISKRELASLLGTIPETLSRIMGSMKAQGLIEVQNRTIRLLDRSGLESLAVHGKDEEF